MHAFAGEGVEEHGEGCHEGLALAGGHLGDVVGRLLAVEDAVEHHAAYELHIVVYHVPLNHIASGHPFVLVNGLVAVDGDEVLPGHGETAVGVCSLHFDSVVLGEAASRLLDYGEDFGEGLVKFLGVHLEAVLAEVVYLLPEGFALVVVEGVDFGAYLVHAVLVGFGFAADVVADEVYAVAELVGSLAQELFRNRVYLFFEALPEGTHCALALVAEHFLKYAGKSHELLKK